MKSRDKEIMVKRLNEVIPVLECPMCHNRQFAILDGYLVFPVPEDYRISFLQTQKTLPAIAIICTKCGYISQHSLGILGLLEKEKQEIQEEEIEKDSSSSSK